MNPSAYCLNGLKIQPAYRLKKKPVRVNAAGRMQTRKHTLAAPPETLFGP